jgi:hypothetical protein
MCRTQYPKSVCWMLWGLCEIAIAATDMAEVVGTAIGSFFTGDFISECFFLDGFNLVLGLNLLIPALPIIWAVVITGKKKEQEKGRRKRRGLRRGREWEGEGKEVGEGK